MLPLRLGGERSELVRRVLGSARDTRDKYTVVKGGKRVWTRERKAQHRNWIEGLFAESGVVSQPKGKRGIVFVAGGPASGKSSAQAFMPQLDRPVEIDQDYFKNKIGEYRRLAGARDPYASDAVHREAARIAHHARLEAMRRGYNVIVQGVGNSAPRQFADKIVDARRQGYEPHAFYVTVPTDLAFQRARERGVKTGRVVPEEGLRAMHANVSKRFAEVAGLPKGTLASLQVFDTRDSKSKGSSARRIMHLDASGRMVVDHAALAHEFLVKAKEHGGGFIRHKTFV